MTSIGLLIVVRTGYRYNIEVLCIILLDTSPVSSMLLAAPGILLSAPPSVNSQYIETLIYEPCMSSKYKTCSSFQDKMLTPWTDAHRSWHQSFLPSILTDRDEPRLVSSYRVMFLLGHG